MHLYTSLILLGVSGLLVQVFMALELFQTGLSLGFAIFFYLVFFTISVFNARAWKTREYDGKIQGMKAHYEKRISLLKSEYDTATLEMTIRDGTRTLIKNALDYFKIENIKKEMGPSAAIQNLQLDKYGQIIELLADFSLILPDYDENRRIVQQEIHHLIEIYRVDERLFAEFLRTIMGKYQLTVNKKIRERLAGSEVRPRACPSCGRQNPPKSLICRHCGEPTLFSRSNLINHPANSRENWEKRAMHSYREGDYPEAVKLFSLAIEADPGASNALFRRGLLLRKLGDMQRGLDDLRQAARLGHAKAGELLQKMSNNRTREWRIS
ncbi:MAG: hypothetical protein CSB33_03275 [Desulfobacterales bacterium]|nr:MAG: hypothetical protein CSB33_03275 [Desulfobacterales bacterium]